MAYSKYEKRTGSTCCYSVELVIFKNKTDDKIISTRDGFVALISIQ